MALPRATHLAALLAALAPGCVSSSLADADGPGCEGDGCCVPRTCEHHYAHRSGTFDDGCGGTLACSCGSGEFLLADGATCAPCACGEGDCGLRPSACGLEDCGLCEGLDVCGGGGEPGRCACVPTGRDARCAGRCGELSDCGEPVDCGGCAAGTCSPELGICLAEPRPFCWDAPVAWSELEAPPGQFFYGILVVEDGDGLAGYAQVGNAEGTYLRRYPLAGDGFTPRGPPEPLDHLTLEGYRSAVVPTIRSDGLELIFRTLRVEDGASRALVSTRASVHEPWGQLRDLELPVGDTFFSLLLLDDHRTLLVLPHGRDRAVVLRRPTTEPGAGGFEVYGNLVLDTASHDPVGGLAYGCQRDVILTGSQPDPGDDRVLAVPLTDPEQPDVGGAAVVDVADPGGLFAGTIEAPTESPGCGQLQLAVGGALYRSARRPCP